MTLLFGSSGKVLLLQTIYLKVKYSLRVQEEEYNNVIEKCFSKTQFFSSKTSNDFVAAAIVIYRCPSGYQKSKLEEEISKSHKLRKSSIYSSANS